MNFSFYRPLNGHDEDAPPYADGRMLVVCDGLGGGGQNKYKVDGEIRTSAYLGSRRVSQAFREFVDAHYDELCENMQNPGDLIADMKAYISNSLDDYVKEKNLVNLEKGKSMQMLPTTLAAIVYKKHDDYVEALAVSAGDSRAFIFTPENGLQQISVDDAPDGIDAFSKEASMTNNICQGKDYHINYSYYKLPAKCILFVCSDGCFDYLNSPMELEFRMASYIVKCANAGTFFSEDGKTFGEMLGDSYMSNQGDDCTMAGAVIGYTDIEEIKKMFYKRGSDVRETYCVPYIDYMKEANKRKSETTGKIPEQEKEVKALEGKIDVAIKDAITETFRACIKGPGAIMTDVQRRVAATLEGSELFKNFITGLEEKSRKAAEYAESKKTEYKENYEQLKDLFFEKIVENFLESLTGASRINIFKRDDYEQRCYEEYNKRKSILDQCKATYEKIYRELTSCMAEFNRVGITERESADEMNPQSVKFMEYRSAYDDYISQKQYLRDFKTVVRSEYIKKNKDNIMTSFTEAWGSGFEKYNGQRTYIKIVETYRVCKDLQPQCSAVTITDEEKIRSFTAYFEENADAFIGMIKADEGLYALVCGKVIDEIDNAAKKLEEIKAYVNEFDNKQLDLWNSYKPVYELFKNRTAGGSV